MLNFEVGIKNVLDNKMNIEVNGVYVDILAIFPMCNTKIDLKTSLGDIKLKAFQSETSTYKNPIPHVVYDLDMYVDVNQTLFIRPTREYVFNYVSDNIPNAASRAGVEHINDLQMDILFKLADSALSTSGISLTPAERLNYDKLKKQWLDTTTVQLSTVTYEIDYAFNGSGVGSTPKGLKGLGKQIRTEYVTILMFYNYSF